jgi:hypothetical protein
MIGDRLQIYVSVWMAPPVDGMLGGEYQVPPEAPAGLLILAALRIPANSIHLPYELAIKSFAVYNRTRQQFLDPQRTLEDQGVLKDDHIIVTLTWDPAQIDRRFAPNMPTPFDTAVRAILNGK